MRKILTLTVAIVISLATFSQKTYVAYKTEIHRWKNNEWTLSEINRNVEIPIHIVKRFIHIQAKDNAYFLIDNASVDINGKSFKGVTYDAYEFVTETKCSVHAVDFSDGESMLSIVWFQDGVNIRYFLR